MDALGKWLPVLTALAAVFLLGQALGRNQRETAEVTVYQGQSQYITGAVICEKHPIPQGERTWYPLLLPGQRAAAGQAVYQREPASWNSFSELRTQGNALAPEGTVIRRETLCEALVELGGESGKSRVGAAETFTAAVSDKDPEVEDASGVSADTLTAPVSGVFVPDPTGETAGAIVTGQKWFLRLEGDFLAEQGETLTAYLLSGIFETVELTVEETGGGGLLLSCEKALSQAVLTEKMTLKIETDPCKGLEIPSEAVYTDKDGSGVWCLVGDSVRWKPVEILRREGDSVIVVRGDDSDGLRPGDTVLLEYEGK